LDTIIPRREIFCQSKKDLQRLNRIYLSKMEVNIMQCSSCERTHSEDEKWHSCPECGKVLCLECAEGKEKKEVAILKKVREGDAHTRLELLCPSCGTGMFSPR
jgi:predicted RNA-binding Zn-ribbon protein involved in translation (DUF1610 family)